MLLHNFSDDYFFKLLRQRFQISPAGRIILMEKFFACSVATFIHVVPLQSAFVFRYSLCLQRRIEENHNESQRMARTMKKAFELLRQKLFFILLQNNIFLKKSSELNKKCFFLQCDRGDGGGMKHSASACF